MPAPIAPTLTDTLRCRPTNIVARRDRGLIEALPERATPWPAARRDYALAAVARRHRHAFAVAPASNPLAACDAIPAAPLSAIFPRYHRSGLLSFSSDILDQVRPCSQPVFLNTTPLIRMRTYEMVHTLGMPLGLCTF